MRSIKQILMDRDGLTAEEADDAIAEAKRELEEILETEGPFSESAHDICATHFGLEPDYIEELVDFV
jgi:hypothetical protein